MYIFLYYFFGERRRPPLEFEWDADKRLAVIAGRGVDFREAALIFEGHVLSRIDDRHDYGEMRHISIGMVGNECYVVVHTRRGDATRIISAWLGGKREKEQYRASITGTIEGDEGSR